MLQEQSQTRLVRVSSVGALQSPAVKFMSVKEGKTLLGVLSGCTFRAIVWGWIENLAPGWRQTVDRSCG